MARVRIRRRNGAYIGSIQVGTYATGGVGDMAGDSIITIGAVGATPGEALTKASLIAERIVNDPIMSAILPPQAKAAIVATKQLASAARHGKRALKSLWGRLRGKGKKRLAKALAKTSTRAPSSFRASRTPPPMAPEEYDDEGESTGTLDILDPEVPDDEPSMFDDDGEDGGDGYGYSPEDAPTPEAVDAAIEQANEEDADEAQ